MFKPTYLHQESEVDNQLPGLLPDAICIQIAKSAVAFLEAAERTGRSEFIAMKLTETFIGWLTNRELMRLDAEQK